MHSLLVALPTTKKYRFLIRYVSSSPHSLLLPPYVTETSHCTPPLQQAAAVVNSGLLLMAVMGILFPAVLYFTHSEVHQGKSVLSLSRFSSCIMLLAYASYLFFQLRSQQNVYSPVDEVSSFAPFFKNYF